MDVTQYKAGDTLLYSGVIYTARDAAHKLLTDAIRSGKPLPFALDNAAIYYAGPTPARPGAVIGSCGPTTSSRMDDYTPLLLQKGVRVMIGKGKRSADVVDAMVRYGAVYLCAVGGAAAILSRHVTACEVVAYPELGCEAIHRLTVKELPLIVGIDCHGNSILR